MISNVHHLPFTGLRARVLLILAVSFLLIFGLNFYRLNTHRDARVDEAKNQLQFTADMIATEQQRIISYADQVLLNLQPVVRQFSKSQNCSDLLARKAKEYPEFRNMAIAAINGDIICAAQPQPAHINIADREYFKQALQSSSMVISGVTISRTTGIPSLILAHALRDDSDLLVGVYYVALDLSWLQASLASAKHPEGSRLGLLDNTGLLLARYPDPEGAVGRTIAGTANFNAILALNGHGVSEDETPLDGIHRIYAVSTFATTIAGPVLLYVGIPKGMVTAIIERDFASDMGMLLALLVTVFLIIWFGVERGLVRPFAALCYAARSLGEDDFARGSSGPQFRITPFGRSHIREVQVLQRTLLDSAGKLHSAFAERQQAEAAALSANRAKSQFLATMSHEIRTPISVIVGFCHLLLRDLNDTKHRTRIDQINATSEHLLTIVNDILDFSKIEAGRLELDISPFKLGAMVDKVLRMVEGQAQDKELTITADIAPQLSAQWLKGDTSRLAQVLINLCSNAVKFTDQGFVRVGIDCLAEDDENIKLCFAVEDSGIGIATDQQTYLFQPFTQADNSSTRERGGTGLGLAISQQLVTMMGGTIRVNSQLGTGSRFSFELDFPRALAAENIAAPAVPVQEIRGSRVLFAEDHPLSQEILFEMLEDLGCEVDVAANGVEAVDCAQVHSYDLILLDMQMPKMDGLTAALAIRALPGHQHTPILALTANAFAEDRQRCLDAGMNGHIAKPVTPSALATVLSQWLSGLNVPRDEGPVHENNLSRAIANIPGLEVRHRRSPDEIEDYYLLLIRFVKLHKQDMVRLRAHLAAGENEAAQTIAHQLVGIAGLLHAKQIASLASQIDQGMRTGQDVSGIVNLVDLCEIELSSLSEAISTLPVFSAELASH